ncbi:M20/M25/M40 family metallo-hydrolase [Vulcanisaeta souniana]|uniref:M20/M25/M40 family metallo-hydrolase n=1 Tax=Vulcanisaeta souniana TaxID=164452 RepID=UPI001FB4729C|nr:M20/M25/M40 family metallo-hydrolase [Vulcanisaeta souniana]
MSLITRAPSDTIVRLIHEGIEKTLGSTPKPIIVTGGATDGRYLRARGIPTVVYGPGELALAHAYNEYVTVDDLVKTHDVMLYTIKRFFGIPA